jgi:hypothetical protein
MHPLDPPQAGGYRKKENGLVRQLPDQPVKLVLKTEFV